MSSSSKKRKWVENKCHKWRRRWCLLYLVHSALKTTAHSTVCRLQSITREANRPFVLQHLQKRDMILNTSNNLYVCMLIIYQYLLRVDVCCCAAMRRALCNRRARFDFQTRRVAWDAGSSSAHRLASSYHHRSLDTTSGWAIRLSCSFSAHRWLQRTLHQRFVHLRFIYSMKKKKKKKQ